MKFDKMGSSYFVDPLYFILKRTLIWSFHAVDYDCGTCRTSHCVFMCIFAKTRPRPPHRSRVVCWCKLTGLGSFLRSHTHSILTNIPKILVLCTRLWSCVTSIVFLCAFPWRKDLVRHLSPAPGRELFTGVTVAHDRQHRPTLGCCGSLHPGCDGLSGYLRFFAPGVWRF